MVNPLHSHKGYIAFIGHRVTGIALAVFLPFHFLLLGTAISGVESLDSALRLVDNPLFKIAEWGLVVALALHLLFGLRILLLEFTRWPGSRDNRLNWIVPAFVLALLAGLGFVLSSS